MKYKKFLTSGLVSVLLGTTMLGSGISFADTIQSKNDINKTSENNKKYITVNVSENKMINYLVNAYNFSKSDLKGLTKAEIKNLYEYGYKAKIQNNVANLKVMYQTRSILRNLQKITGYNLISIKPYINASAEKISNDKERGKAGDAFTASAFLYHLWRIALDSHWGYRTTYDAFYHYFRDVRHYSRSHARSEARAWAHSVIRDTDKWDDVFGG